MPKGLTTLKELALTHSRIEHPSLPESARYIKPYSDKSANGLTRCIIDYLKFKGHQGERINCTGRYLDQRKIVTDTLDRSQWIGSGTWIPGTGTRGTADISATINGKSVKIEVKMKDRQSPDQKKYQEQIELAGGQYWLVRSFEEFICLYNSIV